MNNVSISELVPPIMNEDDLKCLLSLYLKGWTEIPFNLNDSYDKNELIFYDGFIGTILRKAEELIKFAPTLKNDEFIKTWLYQGKLYRVIHPYPKEDRRCKGGFRNAFPKVEYHGMITHWTKDSEFKAFKKLTSGEKYIILEADTKDHLAFDINLYRKKNGIDEEYTKDEEEVIFPMYKENINEYKMTIEEFNNTIVKKNRDN